MSSPQPGELVRMVVCGHIMRIRGRKGELGATTKKMVTCKVCGKISFAVWVSLQEWWKSDQYKQLVASPAAAKGTGLQREGAPVR